MSSYRPYLLPLFPLPGYCKVGKIQSPLDEESLIRSMRPSVWPGWEQLSILIREAYGLKFFRESSAKVQVLDSGAVDNPEEPDSLSLRYLVLKAGDYPKFALEHPDGLILFDRLAKRDHEPILAMPSLFTEWWLQRQDPDQGMGFPERVDPGNEQQAIVTHLLRLARNNPTDWHLEAREGHFLSRLRIDGLMCREETSSHEKGLWFINSLTRLCNLGDSPVNQPREGNSAFEDSTGQTISIRISLVPTLYGESLAVRFLYPELSGHKGLHELGFPEDQVNLLEYQFQLKEGMWIIAGPTGAGKTTTLHAILQWSVDNNEKVLAAEDPVERILDGIQQVSVGNPPGLLFSIALKAFMRQSPDSILIGEIRDEETAAISIQAARTGHRVLCSLHARNPPGISRRFDDLGQRPADLDQVVRVAILQRLVPILCPDCREFRPLPNDLKDALGPVLSQLPGSIAYPVGCRSCRSGYKGRTAVSWTSVWPVLQPVENPFLAAADRLFASGNIDLKSLLPFLPTANRMRFRFANGKDSVKTPLNPDLNCPEYQFPKP